MALSDLGTIATKEMNNSGTKYQAYANNGVVDAWCAMFVRWCAKEAGVEGKFGTSNKASDLKGALGNFALGTGIAPSSNIPKVGDLAFVNSKSDTDKTGSVNHVAIITSITSTTITTVNGNWLISKYPKGIVSTATYNLNGTSKGSGWGCIVKYGKNS